jgi:hypothetical protein
VAEIEHPSKGSARMVYISHIKAAIFNQMYLDKLFIINGLQEL